MTSSLCCSSAAAQPHRALSLHSVALENGSPVRFHWLCSHCRSPSKGAPLPPAVSQALEACLTWSPGSHLGLPPNALQASGSALFPFQRWSWAGQFLKFACVLILLWVSGFCVALKEVAWRPFSFPVSLCSSEAWERMDISVNNGSLTMALGPFGITLILQIEKLRLSGDSTGLRAHSFKQEQALEVGCPDSTSDAPCTDQVVGGPPVGTGLLACGELAFP